MSNHCMGFRPAKLVKTGSYRKMDQSLDKDPPSLVHRKSMSARSVNDEQVVTRSTDGSNPFLQFTPLAAVSPPSNRRVAKAMTSMQDLPSLSTHSSPPTRYDRPTKTVSTFDPPPIAVIQRNGVAIAPRRQRESLSKILLGARAPKAMPPVKSTSQWLQKNGALLTTNTHKQGLTQPPLRRTMLPPGKNESPGSIGSGSDSAPKRMQRPPLKKSLSEQEMYA